MINSLSSAYREEQGRFGQNFLYGNKRERKRIIDDCIYL